MIVKGSELMNLPCDENDENYKNYMKDDTLWFYAEVVKKALSVYSNFIEKPDSIVIRTNWREVQFVWECKETHLEVIIFCNFRRKTDKYRAIVSLDRYFNDKSHNNVFDEEVSADNILFINKAISKYITLKEKTL